MKNSISTLIFVLLSNLVFSQTVNVYLNGGGFFHFPSNMTLTEATRENKVVFFAGVDTTQKTCFSFDLNSKKSYLYVNGEIKSSCVINEINNGDILDVTVNCQGVEEKSMIYKHSENNTNVFISVFLNEKADRFEGIYCEGKEFTFVVK